MALVNFSMLRKNMQLQSEQQVRKPTTGTAANSNTTAILDLAEYQSAQAYTNEAKQMLDEVRVLAPSNSSSAISNAENGINEMITAINNKAQFSTVDEIVDSKVLPSLKQPLT